MVGSLLHPLNIFVVGLGGGFLIPLLNRFGRNWASAAFFVALATIALISVAGVVAGLPERRPDRDTDGRLDATIRHQPPHGACRGVRRHVRFRGGLAGRGLRRAREVCGPAALPGARHGRSRHGDDARPVQSVRLPRDRVHRHLWTAESGELVRSPLGLIQVPHGHGRGFDLVPSLAPCFSTP